MGSRGCGFDVMQEVYRMVRDVSIALGASAVSIIYTEEQCPVIEVRGRRDAVMEVRSTFGDEVLGVKIRYVEDEDMRLL